MTVTSSTEAVKTKQRRIAELAKLNPNMVFTSLNHFVDLEWLKEAYRRTRKDGACGVDGVTAESYAPNLEENLQNLLHKAKSGTYRAPSVKRVHIPKGNSKTELRPIGIPTFEDKILQRSIVMLLEPIYEVDFYKCSFGFRPGKSAQQALDEVRNNIMKMWGGFIIEVDIRKFFDTLDKKVLREFLAERVNDGVVKRLIGKWLKAGVFEKGETFHPEAGSPQGGVISPLMSNVYLHYVLDKWFHKEVKPRMKGSVTLVRFCDDFIVIAKEESDAERIMNVLPKRFGRFGLTLHEQKTRTVIFIQPKKWEKENKVSDYFDFLGFSHYWERTRNHNWIVKQKTAKNRKKKTMQKIQEFCKENRHTPIKYQHKKLKEKLNGHYSYFGRTFNSKCLSNVKRMTEEIWFKWLNRRSRNRHLNWEKYKLLLKRYPLPIPKINHSIFGIPYQRTPVI